MVVTADLGFVKGGRNWSRSLSVPLAFVEKARKEVSARAYPSGVEVKGSKDQVVKEAKAEIISLIGDVKGRNVLLVDDEVDTAGSLMDAVSLLDKEGALEITVAFTHAVLSYPALERLAKLQDRVREIITTNTIPVEPGLQLPKMTVLSVAPLLGEVIRRAHEGVSVGEMFNE
jgi:ribose-phosphate pyrophosphokinase